MRGGRILVCLMFVISQFYFPTEKVMAETASSLLISHVITGESSSPSSELIAIFNNTNEGIKVTGYCIKNKSLLNVACITADLNTEVYIPAKNYLTFSSAYFAPLHNYVPDTSYSASNAFQVGGDVVVLVNNEGTEVDQVTWGTSGGNISSVTNGTLVRKQDPLKNNELLDTGNMSNDFSSVVGSLSYPQNASFDVITVIDYCTNIEDLQTSIPVGYLIDSNGLCQPDSCLNIEGLQISIPDRYQADNLGNCILIDVCVNMSGIQPDVPYGAVLVNENECIWDIIPLVLNELLPNAMGIDTGNEFIEIYNPSDRTIDLSLYSVQVGLGGEKTYGFPVGSVIGPKEYRSFSDSAMKFTLINTMSRVVLRGIDSTVMGDSGIYENPKEGESWAFIDNMWKYTNQVTPSAENIAMSEGYDEPLSGSLLAPCQSGKYRSPLTNRCRNIATDASMIASCDGDEYRNPDTGRCRKITLTSVVPCKDRQYRSEETNRCRNIVSASTRKPCAETQYRSEITGRCRNIPVASIPNASFAVKPVKDSPLAFMAWWVIGCLILIAIGYALWEWKYEVFVFVRKLFKNNFH